MKHAWVIKSNDDCNDSYLASIMSNSKFAIHNSGFHVETVILNTKIIYIIRSEGLIRSGPGLNSNRAEAVEFAVKFSGNTLSVHNIKLG